MSDKLAVPEEWIIGGAPRPYDDTNTFDVWLANGQVRKARRAGNEGPLTPGQMYFTDCSHPLQNVICSQDDIKAWRISA